MRFQQGDRRPRFDSLFIPPFYPVLFSLFSIGEILLNPSHGENIWLVGHMSRPVSSDAVPGVFFLGWTALKIVLGCFTAWGPSTLQIVNRFLGGRRRGFRWFLSVTLDFLISASFRIHFHLLPLIIA